MKNTKDNSSTPPAGMQAASKAPFKGELFSCFPIPIAKSDLSKEQVFTSILNKLKEQKIEKSDDIKKGKVTHFYSEDKYVLNKEDFTHIKGFLTEKCTQFLNQILNFEGDVRITQSWVNCNTPGQTTHMHPHPNSVISGVLYLDVNEENGQIVFHKHAQDNGAGHCYSLQPKFLDTPMNFTFANLFAHTTRIFKVKTGDLILFPSYLLHSVPVNNTKSDRWCLAFNAIPTHLGSGLAELICN